MKRANYIYFLILLYFMIIPINLIAQNNTNFDYFLGNWVTADKSLSIKVIKENDSYFIVEFHIIKHELFFSADGIRALFQEWGKGPSGDNCGIKINEDKVSLGYYGVDDLGEWHFSKTFYKQN